MREPQQRRLVTGRFNRQTPDDASAGQEAGRRDEKHYFPAHFGGRFSANAFGPSTKSCDAAIAFTAGYSRCSAIACSSETARPFCMACLEARIDIGLFFQMGSARPAPA